MAEYLSVPRERVHVIPHGLELEGHGERQLRVNGSPARIGFFARICHDKGLHLLIDACQRLAARGDVPAFEVHAAGYLGACDRMYLDEIEHRVRRGPLAGRFKYHGELDRAGKIAFLQSLDVLSVPTVYRESKGLPVLEAWANGVPVVLPAHGAFPEMVAATGGGLLHRPLDPADLAEKLKVLLNEPERAKQLGRRGRQAVHERFHARAMAERTLELYKSLRAAMAAGA